MKTPSTVFCPVCRSEREIAPLKVPYVGILVKSVGWAVLFGTSVALSTGWLTGVFLGVLAGALGFVLLEVWESAKGKRDLACPICNFDPLLYRRAPEEAKQRCLASIKQREEIFLKGLARRAVTGSHRE